MTCRLCGEVDHLGDFDHPCCRISAQRLAPGRPCIGCAASRAYWAKNGHRKPPKPGSYEDPQDGFRCSTCGLSDSGHARLVSFGFAPHPCINCRSHFLTDAEADRLLDALKENP